MKKHNEIIANQEAAEFEALNARAQKNHAHAIDAQNQAESIIRQAEEEAKKAFIKAEKAEARRKAYAVKSVVSIAALGVLSGALVWAGSSEMIHPTIWIPAAIVCLCSACVRLGMWFGRVARK